MRWWVILAIGCSTFSKNNERPLGVKMKKFVLMLLVFSLVLCLPGCVGKNATIKEVCEIANSAAPTKIVTTVSLVTNSGDKLSGFYETVTDGTNMIFNYKYQRLNTPQESVETGNYDRVLTEEGTINYKDGVYFSGDLETWRPGTGTAFDLKLNFDRKLFKKADVLKNENGDKYGIEKNMTAEELTEFVGTNLNTTGEATVTIVLRGDNLYSVTITCTTATGTLTITTSYTQNQQNLFPEAETEA